MPPARRNKRQAKVPGKDEEFVTPDKREKDKDGEPRRSRRTPKLSEKLKSYMDNIGNVKKDKNENQKKEHFKKKTTKSKFPSITPGSEQPRVVLQPLPKALIVDYSRKSPIKKVPKTPVTKSQIRKTKGNKSEVVRLNSARASPSTSNSKARNLAVKRRLEQDKSRGALSFPPETKRKRTKLLEKITTESLWTDIGISDNEDELIPKVNKDILNKLIGFGAEIAEAIDSNSEAIVSLSTESNKPRRNILNAIKTDKSQELTDTDVNAILQWLDDEENQRRTYRKRILQSLRASHEINMALYNQMLQVLQSVTLST